MIGKVSTKDPTNQRQKWFGYCSINLKQYESYLHRKISVFREYREELKVIVDASNVFT